MLNSKQRAALRSMAAQIQPIMQIGKGGITENLVKTVSDALEAWFCGCFTDSSLCFPDCQCCEDFY